MNIHSVKVVRSARRTVSICIDRELVVTVRAPYGTSDEDIERLLREKSGWIEQHLALQRARALQAQAQPALTAAERERMRERTRALLLQRVPVLAARIGVEYTSIRVGFQKTRFGSCSSSGTLSFHAALCRMPSAVMDYVIIHELCHRRHMNHSSAFWAEVARHCPDYRACRAWLKAEGAALTHL